MSVFGSDARGRADRRADPRDSVRPSLSPDLFKALAMVKLAAARAGVDCAAVSREVPEGIERACLEIIDGNPQSPFPLDLLQEGAGTALRVGMALGNRRLINAIKALIASLRAKGQEFGSILKMGGRQFPAAAPLTLGPELAALGEILAAEVRTLEGVHEVLCDITVEATAMTTGRQAPVGYAQRFTTHLASLSGLTLAVASDPIDATSDPFGIYSSLMTRLAITLAAVCHDLRLLASVPRFRLRGIAMEPAPASAPTSRRVANPMHLEMVTAARQPARHVAEPAGSTSVFEAQTLFINALDVLRLRCVDGITANPDVRRHDADAMLVAFALATFPGLDGRTASDGSRPEWQRLFDES